MDNSVEMLSRPAFVNLKGNIFARNAVEREIPPRIPRSDAGNDGCVLREKRMRARAASGARQRFGMPETERPGGAEEREAPTFPKTAGAPQRALGEKHRLRAAGRQPGATGMLAPAGARRHGPERRTSAVLDTRWFTDCRKPTASAERASDPARRSREGMRDDTDARNRRRIA